MISLIRVISDGTYILVFIKLLMEVVGVGTRAPTQSHLPAKNFPQSIYGVALILNKFRRSIFVAIYSIH
jgi:hypothetical protein